MNLDPEVCFRATRSRERRFDGRFFVAKTATRIYCRPSVSPIELAQTQRLLLAKRLLRETPMSLADVAFAPGFGSVRRGVRGCAHK